MSLSELKIVINEIIDDYNLDIILLVGIIIFGIYTFCFAPLMYVNTTDAVIDGHIINVTSRASGQIVQSYIMKDQEVRKGDLIMEIDSSEYENELIKLDTELEINKQKLRILTNSPLPEDELLKITQENANPFVKKIKPETDKNISKPPSYKKGATDYTNYSRTYEPEDLAQTNLARKKVLLGDAVQRITDVEIPKDESAKSEEESKKEEINKTKIDVSNDTIDSVRRTMKNLETQKEEVKLRLSGTKVFAPRDGIISSVSISQGDIVNLSDVLCTIIPKQVWVLARVNPEQLPKVQIGQTVKIKIPTYKHRTFKGTITSVDTTSKVYQVKAHEHVPEIGYDGKIIQQEKIPYQIKIDFIEDYSDFRLPPDTEVSAKIQVQSWTK